MSHEVTDEPVVYDMSAPTKTASKKPWPKPDAWDVPYDECSLNMKTYMLFGRAFMWIGCLCLPCSPPATDNPLSVFTVAGDRIRKRVLFAVALLLVVGGLETSFYLHLPVPTIWGYHHIAMPRTANAWFHFLLGCPFTGFACGFLGGCIGVIIMAIHICIDTEISVESR